MGQAKLRGTYQERKDSAIARASKVVKPTEQKPKGASPKTAGLALIYTAMGMGLESEVESLINKSRRGI